MTVKAAGNKARAPGKPAVDDLSKYGISRVSVDHFYYGDYRYTDLKDAVAQAKRDLKASAG